MKINEIVVEKVKDFADFKRFVGQLGLKPKHLIIKPNWVEPIEGSYTEAKVLEFLFRSFDCPKTIIESYTFWRTQKWAESQEDYFSSKEATLATGKKHWDHFKKQEQWFLEWSGIGKLLKKYDVDYINITEEVWSKKTVDPKIIKRVVEKKYGQIGHQELYRYFPQRLFNLRGNVLISFAKAKTSLPSNVMVTLSTKNLFGLIPHPIRCPRFHLEDEKYTGLSQSILDIHRIYRSFFDLLFVAEGIFLTLEGPWPEEFNTVRNWGMIVSGKNSIEVDAVMAYLMGLNLEKAKPAWFVKAKEAFGGYDHKILGKVPKKFIQKFKKPK